ncbi:methylmalonyl Co-A mutase-associated GTPase MeaB [Candidatus Halobonum tyrrellensis]|uniref:LAO/AO transport system ATPase n=1 Tax=Candidatus Halobonum tyrrellensis G22 TaxID=1324957 RepID=V4J188_9EURY|nr:methylmalonyl Co-A mutase-associated GTPase MeaB [Candidatus Halobonum tyrrellensis]ESP89217.1 LAO/AO transport system ATPase [Candidatus Halobonum tyrrellensis G22]
MTPGDSDGETTERDGASTASGAAGTERDTGGDGRDADLVDALLDGEHRALARVISKIENRAPGYRDIVSRLHEHTGSASVVGVTGSPGAGKSTLVDKLARAYRDRGETVGVIAVDPSSPYTGGAVLGDRIRMASNAGDMDVFFRSMSARGTLGGLSTATADAVKALDAFGKDRVVIETVGAGQNEVEVVRTADTVAVLVQPGSGDDVQMLKAGILEIGDVFVVNKADMDGAGRTVADLREMLHMRDGDASGVGAAAGHHGVDGDGRGADANGAAGSDGPVGAAGDADRPDDATDDDWDPEVLETVATDGEGVGELLDTLDAHRAWLESSGRLADRERERHAAEIRHLLRSDAAALLERELDARGGVDALAERVRARETDPYAVADEVLAPLADCVGEGRETGDRSGDE